MIKLTTAGRLAAEHDAANGSIVAQVALQADRGEELGWPEAFQQTSIEVMNENGERFVDKVARDVIA